MAHLAEQAWPGFDVADDDRVLYTRADRRECDVVLITNRPTASEPAASGRGN